MSEGSSTTEIILTQQQLAQRWGMAPETLANWRVRRIGPSFIRLHGRRGPVRYRLCDIEAYERKCTIDPADKRNSIARKCDSANITMTMTEALRRRAREFGESRPLARAAGIEPASLRRFLRGDSSLRLDLADQLAAVLGVEVRITGESRAQKGGR